jgi:hypothetical protein
MVGLFPDRVSTMRVPIAVALFTCSLACASHANEPRPLLHSTAGDLAAACLPGELATLRAEVTRLSGGRAPDDAWRLTTAMMCQEGPGAYRVISLHMPERIAHRIEGPSVERPEVTFIGRDAPQLANGYGKGGAWGATAQAENSALDVSFSTGETCWAGFSMRFDGRAWLLVGVHGGCD